MNKVFALFFSFFLVSCSTLTSSPQPIPSDNDTKQYRALVLPNQLQVLLVSDPDAEKAAASLDLHVGSRQDPVKSQGLAHFLEHMLFLGTEKYPEPGAYQAFINDHGGRHNAYTAFEHTNYFFDVNPDYLEPALDRFSQFFVAPLFTQEYVEREKNAVHSEYTSKLKNDARKSLDVFKTIINPEHPFSKFSVGNLETLSSTTEGELRSELIEFYQKYYSANLMRLVVVGRNSLDELQQMVSERFVDVANYNTSITDIEVPLFAEDTLPRQVSIKPEKAQRMLSLSFPVADVYPHYREKPLAYLGNIIGHEGEGSLLSFLKDKGWAEGLSAGSGFSYRGGGTFGVTIKLTELGFQQKDQVVEAVFQTVNRIQQKGVQEWLYLEQQATADVQFRYKESMPPISYSRMLANDMQYYAAKDVLRGPYLMADFDKALIESYLSALTPDNLLLTVTAPEAHVEKRSPYYQTPYIDEVIAQDLLTQWREAGLNEAIQLPAVNDFIATEFTLQPSGQPVSQKPQLLLDQKNNKWWFKNDDEFNVPKGFVSLSIRSPYASSTAEQAVMLKLYAKMLREQVNEFAYPASLAGLHYSISGHMRGVSLKVSGFNEKQHLLFEKLLNAFMAPEFKAEIFERLKKDMQRNLVNAQKEQPYGMLMGDLSEYLYRQIYSEQQLLAALSPLTLEQLQAYVQTLHAQLDINGLVYGNFSEQQATAFMRLANKVLLAEQSKSAFELPATDIYRLSAEQLLVSVENEYQDAGLLYYVQAKDNDELTKVAFDVAAQLYKPSFYTQLRTEKQLGYIVTSGTYSLHKVPGLFFMVQSPVAAAPVLQQEVGDFLQQKSQQLAELNESQFLAAKQVIMKRLSQLPTNLGESNDRYWQDIAYSYYSFDYRQRMLDALSDLSFERWQSIVSEQLFADDRQGMWLYTSGGFKDAGELQGEMLENREAFESQRGYYSFQ